MNDLKEKNNIENNSLFNLKNVFVFKDIRNATEWQFDFFPVKDYVWESKMYYDKFKNDPTFTQNKTMKTLLNFD